MGENVALQKQLIKLERQNLKAMMKSSPMSQFKGVCEYHNEIHVNIYLFSFCLTHTLTSSEAQTEVEELRKEIEGLREKVHKAEPF